MWTNNFENICPCSLNDQYRKRIKKRNQCNPYPFGGYFFFLVMHNSRSSDHIQCSILLKPIFQGLPKCQWCFCTFYSHFHKVASGKKFYFPFPGRFYFLPFTCKNVQIQSSHFRGAIFGFSFILKNLQMELVAHSFPLFSVKQYNF